MKSGDVPQMAASYADNAMSFMPGMAVMNGRGAIENAMKDWVASSTVNEVTFATTDVVLEGELAIETGTFRMTSTMTNAKPKTESGNYLAVWQRQSDGSWRVIRDMSTPDASAMTATK